MAGPLGGGGFLTHTVDMNDSQAHAANCIKKYYVD